MTHFKRIVRITFGALFVAIGVLHFVRPTPFVAIVPPYLPWPTALVLAITLAVTGRLLYGFWRGWNAWQSLAGETSWAAAAGIAGSLAAGAVILGYYFAYWLGVRSRAPRGRN